MADFLIEPLQALQFGDGRSPGEGGTARSVQAPWPQTLRGAIRAALAHRLGRLKDLVDGFDAVVEERVGGRNDLGTLDLRGPLPATRNAGDRPEIWVPLPQDLELFEVPEPNDAFLRLLRPVAPGPGDGWMGLSDAGPVLVPMSLDQSPMAKPIEQPLPWMPWNAFLDWAAGNWDDLAVALGSLVEDGRELVLTSEQVHVVLTKERAARSGGLFVTEHLEIAERPETAWWIASDSLAEDEAPMSLTLGGQQGLARMIAIPGAVPEARPGGLPDKVASSIVDSGGYLRLLVLTPALFSEGFLPEPSLLHGGQVRAALVPGFQAVSGSRLLEGGRAAPRAARRAVPPGSVFVVRYDSPRAAVDAARALWFTNLSSRPEDRLLGYGLIAVGGYGDAQAMDRAWDAIWGTSTGGMS